MRNILFFWMILCYTFNVNAQKLQFNQNKQFKIIQLTDIHYVAENKENSKMTQNFINEIIYNEKPDCVVFTGDIVVGKPIFEGWDAVLEPFIQNKIPYIITLGNHDDEQDVARPDIYRYICEKPFCLNKKFTNKKNNDGVVPIYASESGNIENLLYFIDTNSYTTCKGINGYGWVTPQQIEQFTHNFERYSNKGKNDFSSFVFFHIPLPEYTEAYHNKDFKATGVRLENECSPVINTGLFSQMRLNGDVVGVFCGHDHNNDYIASLHNIALCYGRFSGSSNTYIDIEVGARIILIEEGKREFKTEIYLKDGKKQSFVTFTPLRYK